VIEDDDRFIVKIPLLQKESLFQPWLKSTL
jgi:hypothetical protein